MPTLSKIDIQLCTIKFISIKHMFYVKNLMEGMLKAIMKKKKTRRTARINLYVIESGAPKLEAEYNTLLERYRVCNSENPRHVFMFEHDPYQVLEYARENAYREILYHYPELKLNVLAKIMDDGSTEYTIKKA